MKMQLAIKFGSNEIVIFRKGFGIVARQSSYVATQKSGSKICAFGDEAKRLCNLKGSKYQLNQPIQGLDIIDEKLARALLINIIDQALPENVRIGAIVAVPCALPEKKLLQLRRLLQSAGVASVTFVQNAVCVAAGLDLDPTSQIMVVDMGKYLVDMSALTRHKFNDGRNYLIGGAEMDKALSVYVEDNYGVKISAEQAQTIKDEISSMYEQDMYTIDFDGVTEDGEYKAITIRANEVRVAIIGVYEKIFDLIDEFLESLPNESEAEIRKNGIVFTGGVSAVNGLIEYALKRLNMPVRVAPNPKDAVVLGAGKLLAFAKDDYVNIKL